MDPDERPTKKNVELGFFIGFLKLSGLCQGARPMQTLQDPPDLFLDYQCRRIAVEITRIHVDGGGRSARREGEANRQWVTTRLQRLLRSSSIRPLHVWLSFSRYDLPCKGRKYIAQRILELVQLNDPVGDQPVEVDWRQSAEDETYGTKWPTELDSMNLFRPRGWQQHEVVSGDFGWAMTDCVKAIQDVIDKKGKALGRYDGHYDDHWLLIVAEGNAGSSFIAPDGISRVHRYRTRFSRAFYYQHHYPTYFELLAE
jgi:hypothetical protein